ncbi:MAG: 3-dehydroquinate synthase [Chloroflexota bacterium]|nr:3-dehydroquinate synthase [Chloroflexota bacterium]
MTSPPAGAMPSAPEPEVAIGDGIAATLGERMRALGLRGRAFVVTDSRVAQRYGEVVLRGLADAGFRPAQIAVAGGEGAKSLAQAGELYAWLADQHAERRDAVVALGGGVIGDLAGFVAATYLRGVSLVQLPTTVLAQVDSAIGGKTAVNLPQGKNLVGAFYPARLTLIDVALLDHLPPRELRNGWAEVIKTAVIFDPAMFEELEGFPVDAMSRAQLLDVIARCVRWKTDVVREDPTEQGRRMLLNFGHTIGHALESACGYETYLHGEAVAIGMAGVADLSQRLGLIDPTIRERIERSLLQNDLPVRYRHSVATPEVILRAAAADKKSRGARLRWILSTGLGQTTIRDDIPHKLVLEVLEALADRP